MRETSISMSLWSRRWFRMVSWAILIVLILASLPFLVEFLIRLADWLPGFLPQPSRLWEVSPWSS
jgi:hypothetical protein